jgi:transposase
MGKEEKSGEQLFYNFHLDERIPEGHILKCFKTQLNLDFLYKELKDKYGDRGNISVPPPIIMKMMLLLVLYNVRSERELMDTIPLRLDWIWFLGYSIEDTIPHHSVLSKARKRWGVDVFEKLFKQLITKAVNLGLIDGSKIFVDASLVKANASKDSLKNILDIQLEDNYQELINRLEDRAENNPDAKVNSEKISTTDPDAGIVSKKGNNSDLYYKIHRASEGSNEIITSCEVSTGYVNEAHILEKNIDEHEKNVGGKAGTIVADSKYGTKDNFSKLKEKGYTTHIRDLEVAGKKTSNKSKVWGKEMFKYDDEKNVYICPAGKILKKRRFNKKRKTTEYLANMEECKGCKYRKECTNSRRGRTIQRYHKEEYLIQGKKDAASKKCKDDLKTRQHLIERSFANGKRYGYKHARWRSLPMVKIQQLLIAIVQNMVKIRGATQRITPIEIV